MTSLKRWLLLSGLIVFASTNTLGYEIQIKGIKVKTVLAMDDQSRAKGLGGYNSLGEKEGMLFIYQSPQELTFWMKGMLIPIDIIWINKGKVVFIEKNIQPPAINTSDNDLAIYGRGVIADTVLEVQAGFSERHGIKVGDKVFF